jgi:hypothetical protein
MRLRVLAFACAVALGVACSWLDAAAETALFVGTTVPVGQFSYARKMGLYAGGDCTYAVTPFVDVGGMAAYNRLSPPADRTGHSHLIEVLALGRLHAPVGVFLLGGAGLTYSSLDFSGQGGSSTAFAEAGGLGFSFLQLRLTGMYHRIQTDGHPLSYVTVAVESGF